MSTTRGLQLSRLLAVRHLLVQARDGVTVAAAAHHLGVSRSTAERYLREFEAAHLARVATDPEHRQRLVWRAA